MRKSGILRPSRSRLVLETLEERTPATDLAPVLGQVFHSNLSLQTSIQATDHLALQNVRVISHLKSGINTRSTWLSHNPSQTNDLPAENRAASVRPVSPRTVTATPLQHPVLRWPPTATITGADPFTSDVLRTLTQDLLEASASKKNTEPALLLSSSGIRTEAGNALSGVGGSAGIDPLPFQLWPNAGMSPLDASPPPVAPPPERNGAQNSTDVGPATSVVPLVAVGADLGSQSLIKVYEPRTMLLKYEFLAEPASYRGGVRLAVADVTGDGVADVITGTGPGGDNRVRVFDGRNGNPVSGVLAGFSAFTAAQADGVFVAAGDVDGDQRADLVVGTDQAPLGLGRVRVFSGRTGMQLFDRGNMSNLGTSIRVAAADVTGDGRAEVVVAAGPGALPVIGVLDGRTGATLRSFYSGDPYSRHGLFVAAGDLNRDGKAEIVTGAATGVPEVRIIRHDALQLARFLAEAPAFAGGVRVAVTDVDGDGQADVLAGGGLGTGRLRVLDHRGVEFSTLYPFGTVWSAGLFQAGSVVQQSRGPVGPGGTVILPGTSQNGVVRTVASELGVDVFGPVASRRRSIQEAGLFWPGGGSELA